MQQPLVGAGVKLCVMRVIPKTIPSFTELKLPQELTLLI
jgi:hypothetical protein